MISGRMVRPKKWSKVIDLYDDGEYSAIWGYYDNSNTRCLGVRWNGDNKKSNGYPIQGKYPLWYVEPHFLTKCILEELLKKVLHNKTLGDINNIQIALNELK